MKITINDKLENFYLSWINDFLTISKFATYHGMDKKRAIYLIDLGKCINNGFSLKEAIKLSK